MSKAKASEPGKKQPATRKKNPGGRPCTYDTKVSTRICEELAAGRSLREICLEEDWAPSQRAVFRWLAKYEEFRHKYEASRQLGLERRAIEIMEIADEEPAFITDQNGVSRVDSGWVQWQRLRIDSRKWELSKLLPRKYGDSIDLNHGVQPDNPIIDLMTQVAGSTLRPRTDDSES